MKNLTRKATIFILSTITIGAVLIGHPKQT